MPKRIQYLGSRELHTDTLFGTGLAWHGKGDIQTVEDDAAAMRMVGCCPLTYRNLTDAEEETILREQVVSAREEVKPSGILVMEPSLEQEVPIEEASRLAIEEKAKSMGMKVTDTMSRDQLMFAVLDLADALKNPRIRTGETEDVDPYDYFEEAVTVLTAWIVEQQILHYRNLPKVLDLKKKPPEGLHKEHINSLVRTEAWRRVKEQRGEKIRADREAAPAEHQPELAF